MMNFIERKVFDADYIGMVASVLCLIHCLATPFLFIAKACSVSCCAEAPLWWRSIDFVFIVISFVAIYFATNNSTVNWIKIALWSSWGVLLLAILNETFVVIPLPGAFVYFPALLIVGFHFYNLKYCKCKNGKCCIS